MTLANQKVAVIDLLCTLNGYRGHKDLPELFAETSLAPDVFAQLLMEHLPIDGMGFANKEFWLKVAEYMGPDFIRTFRHVGGFMDKVSEF